MEVSISYDHCREKLELLPVEELARFVLEHEKVAPDCEVSITFVTDETIAELNKRYRGKDEPTDVLSFECDGAEEEAWSSDGSSTRPFILGDVIIAPDVAARQTNEYGTSFEEEISLLLVHGLLHLCGYDHIEEAEAELMEGLEAQILEAWTERS